MGVSLKVTTPIKFSLTLINSDVHCILCKVYNRVDSSNITSQTWIFYFFRFFSQKTETEFWLLYIRIPKSDYLYQKYCRLRCLLLVKHGYSTVSDFFLIFIYKNTKIRLFIYICIRKS